MPSYKQHILAIFIIYVIILFFRNNVNKTDYIPRPPWAYFYQIATCFQNHIIFQKSSDRYCFVNGLNLILVDRKISFRQLSSFPGYYLCLHTWSLLHAWRHIRSSFAKRYNIDFCKKISSNTKIKHIYRALFPKIYSLPESRNQILFPAFRNAFWL